MPSRQALSFCDAEPNALAQWQSNLPKANLGETARLLYQALLELEQVAIPADRRLRLLEQLRPDVHLVCRHLERYFLNQPIVLDARARKIASLCQALLGHLATGYKQVVVEVAGKERQQVLTLGLQRAIHSLCAALVRATQLYCPLPQHLWLELHQLYQYALQQGLQRVVVRDELAHHTSGMSVEQSYLVALLLASARCNQLRQRSIGRLAELLESWSVLATLQPASAPNSLLVVAPLIDGPPRYRSLLRQEGLSGLLGIDPLPLAHAIRDFLGLPPRERHKARLPAAENLDLDLLRHLSLAWGEVAERSFQRTPCQGSMTLCIGMTAVHYYLAGQRTLNDLLDDAEAPKPASFCLDGGAPDVWKHAFDIKPKQEIGLQRGDIEYVRPGSGPAAQEQVAFPTYTLQMINRSPGGYCLNWPDEVPSPLQTGELVGLRDVGGQNWSLAVVRWVGQLRGGGTQMGIELIGPQAQPCALRLLRHGEQNSEFMRALLLAEIPAISQPAMLITPRLPFQKGNQVQIRRHDQEIRATLSRRQSGTSSYSIFEYRILEQARSKTASVPLQKTELSLVEEDFDSLWKSL